VRERERERGEGRWKSAMCVGTESGRAVDRGRCVRERERERERESEGEEQQLLQNKPDKQVK
jgi:hypothetical protein